MRKAWIGAACLVVGGLALAQTAANPVQHKMVTTDQLTWGPPPPGLPPGAQAAVLDGNPAQPGIYVVRLRAPDGYRIKPHWHTHDEHVTVLQGALAMGMGETFDEKQLKAVPAGGYLSMPAKSHHFAMTKGETIIQLSNEGPFDIFYINPSDDPRLEQSAR